MTEKEKCNHNAEHKEVLGHVLCVCCTHCQKELSQAKKEKPAHMCKDGHTQIWHNDSESEMCPLCAEKKEVEKLNDELGTQDAEIIVLRGQLAEWKRWAERLAEVLEGGVMPNGKRTPILKTPGGEEIEAILIPRFEATEALSDFQKFKESQGSKEKQG